VSGSLVFFYEPGNHRRHICPDVFVVEGIATRDRPNYLLWEERNFPLESICNQPLLGVLSAVPAAYAAQR